MSAQEESFIDVNKIDRYASRVFTLAVKFFGTSTAVPSSTIRAELYSDLDDRSFSRQFLRDRNMLASLGMVINEVPTADKKAMLDEFRRTGEIIDGVEFRQELGIRFR